ncbi:MAG: polysaccharide pyruvyl transferase family protein [Marinobacter sp.]|uniref:polysaccharide pyruvyl transferase family protein n=1 Tax=Marinobacter sp. TaxID=50741 RepID=UPI00299F0E66|nr:polysaccharide pyruvyl transferase family protein [Marinobacter sp.]MDX1634513.1 polysaccharide pyruvyl transferase family protein [Marinobacter sp.]
MLDELRLEIDRVILPLLEGRRAVAIFDFPNYANVGDSAIWLGQRAFLRAHGFHVCHVDDCYLGGRGYPELPEDAAILINGGGNFGDLYIHHQKLRESLILQYPRNRIIQLPQSIHFQSEVEENRCANFLKKHGDFHLIVRDKLSFEIAERIHAGPVYLCPDMALYLGRLRRPVEPQFRVVGLLRKDREQIYEHAEAATRDLFCDWLVERRAIGWFVGLNLRADRKVFGRRSLLPRKLVLDWAARARLKRGCRLLSSGRAVVTDRLHAHILCTLMDIPHVVLDNSYGKIRNFRAAWNTGESGLCKAATSFDDALALAKQTL